MSSQQEDGGKAPAAAAALAASRGGVTASGQSVSTSGSAGSPSSRSELATAAATPASDRVNRPDAPGDGAASQGAADGKKKKRGQRVTGPDKSGRGLRQFSLRVCEKVESKGRTTYNEVADELVAEFADPGNSLTAADQQQYDEKNIRRRVYDALNVLMAMDIISKDKKEIQWKGLPRTSQNDVEELKRDRHRVKSRIEKKSAYLQELEEQFIGLQNLIQRNERLYSAENAPSGGIALPFLLVQTRPHATVEVEISEDMQLVHFDFNSTPFELHDDNYVLKAMQLCKRSERHEPTQSFPGDRGSGPNIPDIVYQAQQVPHPLASRGAASRSPHLSSSCPGNSQGTSQARALMWFLSPEAIGASCRG